MVIYEGNHFFKSFVRYKQNVLLNQTYSTCAKVFILIITVKPCEICATKAKYFMNLP